MRGPSVVTSFAAASGSVGPSPYDGHQRATGQAPQAGLLAWQTRRPCQIRWWQSITQSRFSEQRADLVLDLDRVGLVGPAEAAGQPAEVGVDGDAGDAEAVAEHDVGGLAADAGQRHQVVEPRRHLPVVPLDEGGAQLEQRVGLGAEEAERADDLLELLARGAGHRRRRRGRPRTAWGGRR